MLRLAASFASLLVVLTWTLPAAPASYSWNDIGGGVFTDASRWTPAGGPGGVEDELEFDLEAEPRNRYDVTNVSGESRRLLVRTDSLRLELSADYSLPIAEAGTVNFVVGVGPGDDADVIVTGENDAVFHPRYTHIGSAAGSRGALTAMGPGWLMDVGTTVVVGWYGTGELTIEEGARVNSGAQIGVFDGSEGTVTVRDRDSTWDVGSQLSLGVAGAAALAIESGAAVTSSSGVIASADESIASATIRGSRSSWHMANKLFVGYDGAAEVELLSGGAMSAGDAWLGGWVTEGFGTATVVVRGAGSRFDIEQDCGNCEGGLTIGISNLGTLAIEDGGRVSSVDAWLGFAASGVGEVTVSGVDSRWNNAAQLFVGEAGWGELVIEDAGVVTSSDGWIGVDPDATGSVTVRGTESLWENAGELFAGAEGSSLLEIQDGAFVSNAGVWMGLLSGSTSEACVDGAGAWWDVDGALRVGYAGDGTLRVEGGGAVTSASADVAATAGSISSATVTGAESTWTSGTIHVGSAGVGALTISNGGLVESADGIVGDRGSVRVHGAGSAWTLSGALEMEQEEESGTLGIGFSGPASHGIVSVAGTVELAGKLELTVLGGALPAPLDTFTVLTSGGGITGAFSNVANGESLATNKGLGSFAVHYGPASVFGPDHIVLSDFFAVPEPATKLAAWTVVAAIAWLRRPKPRRSGSPGPLRPRVPSQALSRG